MEIIPAILPKDFYEIENKVNSVFKYVKNIQIDICDGIYVSNKTWPFKVEDDKFYKDIITEQIGMPHWQEVNYELDLMLKNPQKHFDNLIKLGPSRLIFHLRSFESDTVALEFLQNIDPFFKKSIEIGLAISAEENIEKIKPFLKEIKFIQIMGIKNIGFQGTPFDEEYFEKVITKIKEIKDLNSNMPISIDGSVSLNTKDALIKVGANRLVSGSAIWQSSDILETINKFKV